MQFVVGGLILPPGGGGAGPLDAAPQRVDMQRGGVQRRLPRDHRLDQEPSAHDLGRVGCPVDVGQAHHLDLARADEGALAHVPPELALRLEPGERLAQVAARHAEDLAECALGRQARVGRQLMPGQPGAQLHQRRLAAVAPPVARREGPMHSAHSSNQFHIGLRNRRQRARAFRCQSAATLAFATGIDG